MQEHPVPQNITSYEFHLIGDMTVKQFFELLIGGALALVSYSSNLPTIFKWPLVIFSVAIGISLAFIPIQERPLDKWIIAFIKAIYNPTKFFWKKQVKIPDIFLEDYQVTTTQESYAPTINPQQRRTRAQDYISSISSKEEVKDDLFQSYQLQALTLQQMFDTVSAAKGLSAPKKMAQDQEFEKPTLHVTTHNLMNTTIFQTSTPTKIDPHIVTVDKEPKTPAEEQKLRHVVNIPVATPTTVTPQEIIKEKEKIEEESPVDIGKGLQQTPEYVITASQKSSEDVRTNKLLPFPKKPTVPNLIVGMVLDEERNILENAIVEIHSSDGIPVRAMKTNMLGQFSISTPLKPGEYTISAEKDNHTFNTYTLSLKNSIVDPIEIQAKA